MTIGLLALFAASCKDDPDPSGDAGPDSDGDMETEDATVDADEEVVPDADEPPPDGTPPTCEAPPADAFEITPDPDYVVTPRLAAGDPGYAALWVVGRESPQEIKIAFFDPDFVPQGVVTAIAWERPFVSTPAVAWVHDAWTVVWSEALAADSCTDPEDCHRELRLMRISHDGTILTERQELWAGNAIMTRAEIVPTDVGAWVFTIVQDVTPRLFAGPIGNDGATLGGMRDLLPERTARQIAPAAALVGTDITIVASMAPGGLMALALSQTGEITAGPETAVSNASASYPAVAVNDGTAGFVYLVSTAAGDNAMVMLGELGSNMLPVAAPVEVSPRAHWPKDPQLAPAGPGWVVAWNDGRRDDASDCVTFGACRNDIFFTTASISGPGTDSPVHLSEDPQDCMGVTMSSSSTLVGALWLTIRNDTRRTAFLRVVPCS